MGAQIESNDMDLVIFYGIPYRPSPMEPDVNKAVRLRHLPTFPGYQPAHVGLSWALPRAESMAGGNANNLIQEKHRRLQSRSSCHSPCNFWSPAAGEEAYQYTYSYDDHKVQALRQRMEMVGSWLCWTGRAKRRRRQPWRGERRLFRPGLPEFCLDGGIWLFYQQALTERMELSASTTKVMTAIVLLKYGIWPDLVTVPEEAVITESGLLHGRCGPLETRCPWKTCFTG